MGQLKTSHGSYLQGLTFWRPKWKGQGKQKKERGKKIKMWRITQHKTKNKRDQVERQLGDPHWDDNLDASAEDGEHCVWPLDDQDLPPKPPKKVKRKIYKSKLRQRWMLQ